MLTNIVLEGKDIKTKLKTLSKHLLNQFQYLHFLSLHLSVLKKKKKLLEL